MRAFAATSSTPRGQSRALRGIVTGEDFKALRTGAFCKDEVPLARGKTIYLGEPVVGHRGTPIRRSHGARRASIEIDYEPLPAVLSIDEALAAERAARP